MPPNLDQYAYTNLATQKRDGGFVWTPVWFAKLPESDRYVVFSSGKAGKVKRLRNFANVRLRPCTATGRPLADALAGKAVLIDEPAACVAAHRAICLKYRWQMRVLDFFSRLSGNYHRRQWIEFQVIETP